MDLTYIFPFFAFATLWKNRTSCDSLSLHQRAKNCLLITDLISDRNTVSRFLLFHQTLYVDGCVLRKYSFYLMSQLLQDTCILLKF